MSTRSGKTFNKALAKHEAEDYSIHRPSYCPENDKKYKNHPYGCSKNISNYWCVSNKNDCNRTSNEVYGKKRSLYYEKGPEGFGEPEYWEPENESQAIPIEEYESDGESYYESSDNESSDDQSNYERGEEESGMLYKAGELGAKALKLGVWGLGKGLQAGWWTTKKGAEAISYINQKRIEAQEEAEAARRIAQEAEERAQRLKEEEERLRVLRRKKDLREGRAKWYTAKEEYLPEESDYLEYIDTISPSYMSVSEKYTDEPSRGDIRNFPKKGPIYGYMPGWDEVPYGTVPWNERHRRYKSPHKKERKKLDEEFLKQIQESTKGLDNDNLEQLNRAELDDLIHSLESDIRKNDSRFLQESQKGGKYCKKHRKSHRKKYHIR